MSEEGGGGGVLAFIEIARMADCNVIATTKGEEKIKAVKKCGANPDVDFAAYFIRKFQYVVLQWVT
ncbi:MAG: hypothetical protein DHS20C07_31540 [Methyloligella sp.]|nr:MAG: hypothetical protein DHS20C07_31540 [Methyloligella sp.]